MKSNWIVLIGAFLLGPLGLVVLPSVAFSAEPTEALATERYASESKNQIVILSKQGILPRTLRMQKLDSFVFFLNDTESDLPSIEVDYGAKRTHCASSNLTLSEDGKARSKEAIKPGDFAIVCFPDQGTYTLKVSGLAKHPQGLASTIMWSKR